MIKSRKFINSINFQKQYYDFMLSPQHCEKLFYIPSIIKGFGSMSFFYR